ncbi:hypothetical protein PRJBM_00285 [Bartonella henselae]|nr:hypothetical protein Q654_00444 [Bartonella henselae JK 50]ETS10669.1 hypothetical protein Q655_00392 [Bartonella henselae JK 51]CDO39679.1 hypothetical protein PRJBM_00285 [Bartonella henselae]CUH90253.1 hypothetical protein BM1374164_00285 [Bartonella henselae]
MKKILSTAFKENLSYREAYFLCFTDMLTADIKAQKSPYKMIEST